MVNTVESDLHDDLRPIAIALDGRYGPTVFPSITMRLADPFLTVSLFQSGRMVVTGATHPTQSMCGALLVADTIMEKLDIPVTLYNFRLRNVVGSLALGYPMDLDAFWYDNQDETEFDPEGFPGLRWEPGKSERALLPKKKRKARTVYILYTTGAVVGTGARTKEQLAEAFAQVMDVFPKYKAGQREIVVPPSQSKYRQSKPRKLSAKERKALKKTQDLHDLAVALQLVQPAGA